MSRYSKSRRSTGSAAIVEDLFHDFSRGREFEPEKLVTTTKAKPVILGSESFNQDSDTEQESKRRKEKKRHKSRDRERKKKKKSKERDRTRDRSRSKSKKRKHKKARKNDWSFEDIVVKSEPLWNDSPEQKTENTELPKASSDAPPLKSEKSDASKSKELNGETVSTENNAESLEDTAGTKPQLNIKAVKLSDYLREKGHEVPKEVLETEQEEQALPLQENGTANVPTPPRAELPNEKGATENSGVDKKDSTKRKEPPIPLAKDGKAKSDNSKDKKGTTDGKKRPKKPTAISAEPAAGAPAVFMPRNLKLRAVQNAKSPSPVPAIENGEAESKSGVPKAMIKKAQTAADKLKEALKKKPPVREPSPVFPSKRKLVNVSDSEGEDFVQAPVAQPEKKGAKKIVFGSIKSANKIKQSNARSTNNKQNHTNLAGEDGELPTSDDDVASTDGELMDLLGDTDGEIQDSDKEENKGATVPSAKKVKKMKKKKEKKKKKERDRSRERRKKDDSWRTGKQTSRRETSRDRDNHYRKKRRSRTPSPTHRRYRSGEGRSRQNVEDGKWAWSKGTIARQRRRDRSRSPNERYRRRRTPSSERDEKNKMLDKEKLLEIAKRNASAMLQAGTLQQIRNMSAEEIATLRSGGKSVDELVDYCKKLQRRAERKKKKKAGVDSSSESEKSEEGETFINHPFVVSQAKIIMNIPNSNPLAVKSAAQRQFEEGQLRLSFPVSSGEQHRKKEPEWTPVNASNLPAIEGVKLKALPAPLKQTPAMDTTIALPPAPAPPSYPAPHIGTITTDYSSSATSTVPVANASGATVGQGSVALEIAAATEEQNRQAAQEESDRVFEDPPSPPPGGIGDIVAKRLDAVKRLQSNPTDVEAMKLMHCAEEQMKRWAESKNLPGQWAGSTGASNLLTPNDFAPQSGPQAWATRDQLRNTKVLDSGVGMYLLQKMGWRPGEGLGRTKAGTVEPLTLDIKTDKRGLISLDEMPTSSLRPNSNFVKDMQGKHPVSALMEVCNKRRWNPPSYTCTESGATNTRLFLWKVVVNGVEYQPAAPTRNKKEAKAQASQVVLQSLGLVPRKAGLPMIIG